MRTPGRQPRILLTNVKELELLLTRQRDVELFAGAGLDFLVFDEAHTFSGAQGAETACLIRRLRSFCGRAAQDTVCIATSATIVDRENPEAARDFASRFFGVPKTEVAIVGETYESEVWAEGRVVPLAPAKNPNTILQACVQAVDDKVDPGAAVWVEIDTMRKLRKGMFAAQVVGKSMEPAIPDGSYCLFAAPVTGTRQGKTVLVQLRDPVDFEGGERYTVKRYENEKVAAVDGTWRHLRITLKPNNPDFKPIELTCEAEGEVQVIAELVEVLG
jgi:hypothetical protein